MQYVERSIQNLDWLTLLLLGGIVILALAKALYPKRFDDFIRLPISNNYFLTKGGAKEIMHPFSLLFFGIQVLSISLFIFLFFLIKSEADPVIFLHIVTAVLVFIFLKVSLEKIIGNIFSIDKLIINYAYKKLTYRNFLAIILLLVNLVFYFSIIPNLKTLLIVTACFALFNGVILYYSYKNHRSLVFSNFFYFLLYLCTLEISPYFILYKALV